MHDHTRSRKIKVFERQMNRNMIASVGRRAVPMWEMNKQMSPRQPLLDANASQYRRCDPYSQPLSPMKQRMSQIRGVMNRVEVLWSGRGEVVVEVLRWTGARKVAKFKSEEQN